MKLRWCTAAGAVAWIWLGLGVGFSPYAQAQSPVSGTPPTEAPLTPHATGTFTATLTPQSTVDSAENLGRMSIAKQFYGDWEATSRGEMLTALTRVRGSAGYVAVEQVSGTLQGRRGTFVLQHSGIMTRGTQQLTVTVVPDSGTDQLVGLAGTMMITIAEGRHSYTFEYTIGSAH